MITQSRGESGCLLWASWAPGFRASVSSPINGEERVFAHGDAERLRWDCAHRCLAPSTPDGYQCPNPDLCPPMLARPSGADVKAEGIWEQHREPVLHAFPSTSSGKLLQNNPALGAAACPSFPGRVFTHLPSQPGGWVHTQSEKGDAHQDSRHPKTTRGSTKHCRETGTRG